ncbi:MAG: S49 family peptidase [Gammaproteobacteria bacterium]|nr:S49 family peptidase [Gammaproteobacteria bacterium]
MFSTRNSPDANPDELAFQRDLINRLSFAALAEQRRSRRWSIFFKGLMFLYLVMITATLFWDEQLNPVTTTDEAHVALVSVSGIISAESGGGGVNADEVIHGLRNAFEATGVKGVIVEINSPGGSPVQSAYIFNEIRRLREKHSDIPLHAVISDIGASGGYYIAAAADNIYVNPSSLIGSIGVRLDSFGFTGAMEKMGIDRRLYTAGENKGALDPFSAVNPNDVAHVEAMLQEVHQQFIAAVKLGRGERLSDDKDLFSGLFWSGERGITLGLADAIGDRYSVARDIFTTESLVDYTYQDDLFARFAQRIGATLGSAIGSQVETGLRALGENRVVVR